MTEGDDVFYYITVLNENYEQPAMPDGVEEGIVRGMYRLTEAPRNAKEKRVSCWAAARFCAR